MAEEFKETVIVKTGMRKIPKCCSHCQFYDNMGGNRGYRNNGVCVIQNFRSTEDIQVTKMRLDTCPLCFPERKKPSIKPSKAVAWLRWMRNNMRDADCREALKLAIEALEERSKEGEP